MLEDRRVDERGVDIDTVIGNESVPKIIINDTVIFFLHCNQHFGNFKP